VVFKKILSTKEKGMNKFTFHVIGISHAKTLKEYSADAFTQKVRLICKMLTEAGHTVIHYGTEGSNPICTEHVSVLSKETFDKVHGAYDWKKGAFLTTNDNAANVEFTKNAIIEINKRKKPTDFLLCSFGLQHKPIADALHPMIIVELGIGYRWSFAPHRIFESYNWMHWIYGSEERSVNPTPNFYDAVIPNYYDLDDYIYSATKNDYFFFIARPTILKGLEIAAKSVEAVGGRLVVAGQGEPPIKSPVIDFVGVVSIEERAKWMSKAKATFVPTFYVEPFGGTVVESLLSGTPVIATDFGAFCVPLETTILTKRGWLTYDQVKVGIDETLGYNFTSKQNEWTKITEINCFFNKQTTEYKNRNWKFRVTDNHKWLVEHNVHNPRNPRILEKLDSIKVCKHNGNSRIITSVEACAGDLQLTPNEGALLGWILTDGGIETAMKNGKRRNFIDGVDSPDLIGTTKIYQTKPKGIKKITTLLREIPHKKYCLKTKTVFVVNTQYVKKLFGKSEMHRRGLIGFVLGMKKETRLAFLNACIDAEGWQASKGSTQLISQNEGPLCDAIELCAYLCGYRPSKDCGYIYKNHTNYTISLSKPVIIPKRLHVGNTKIEDVWCPTTALGTWTAKLGGNIVLTGNSETVPHGKVGYRCRTLEQFIWATKNIHNIKPKACRQWAEKNYAMKRVCKMYEEYFDMLHKLYTNTKEGWYQQNPDRTNLDWLNKEFI